MAFRRKISTRLLLLGVLIVVLVTIFVFASLLNEEASNSLFKSLPLTAYDNHQPQYLTFWNPVSKKEPTKYSGAGKTSVFTNPLDVPRIAEYCNIPEELSPVEEGDAPAGYSLTSVHMLIRHGDRTPMHAVLDIPKPSPHNGCQLNSSLLERKTEFRNFISDMMAFQGKQSRYNDFVDWALFPQHEVCGNSQLTGNGAFQHLNFGQALNEKYVKKWKLFGDRFFPLKQVKVQSTQYTRTYQSAIAFLYGFLPHFNLTEMNIEAAQNTLFCNPQIVPTACCSAVMKLKHFADKMASVRLRQYPTYIPTMTLIANIFGSTVGQLPWPSAILDMLQGYACHSLPLPCSISGKCISPDIMQKLWSLVDNIGRGFTTCDKYDNYARLAMHSILLEIAVDMAKVLRSRTALKFSLFSGHDITITPLLHVLGLYDGKWPPYASRLVFEQYTKHGAKKEYYLRILYNGQNVTSLVKFCSHTAVPDGMCPFKQFVSFVYKDILEKFQSDSLESLCEKLSKV